MPRLARLRTQRNWRLVYRALVNLMWLEIGASFVAASHAAMHCFGAVVAWIAAFATSYVIDGEIDP